MRSAPTPFRWRAGLAVAVLSVAMANGAAAQDRPGDGGGRFVPGGQTGAGGRGFPVGLGIGLGVAVGLGILGEILSSREPPPLEPPVAEPTPNEPPPRQPPRTGHPQKAIRTPARSAMSIVKVKTVTALRRGGGRTVPRAERPGFVVPDATERRYATDEVLVETQGTLSAATLRRLEASLDLTPVTVARIALLDADVRLYRLRPGASVAATVRVLRRRSLVARAEPNFTFELQDDAPAAPAAPDRPRPAAAQTPKTPTPPGTPSPIQYAVTALHLVEAHRVSTGENVRVALIDSGLDETNPNLEGAVVDRFDAIGGTFAAQAHGTAMGGAIVAHRSLVGVAPNARLIAVRAFAGTAATGTGSGFNVLRGLDFAAAHGARIVNMSFAGPRDMLLRQALEAARSRGIIAIAAAGNGGPSAKPLYPAAEEGIIAVTATDSAGAFFARANRGAYIAVAAPGVDVIAPGLGDSVQISTGTSIASAEASGVAALVLALRPSATPDDIRTILSRTAKPLAGGTAGTGAGLLDAAAAVRAAK